MTILEQVRGGLQVPSVVPAGQLAVGNRQNSGPMGSDFPGAAAASGSKTRDPDDDIELPEDITIEDYLSTMKLMCPDLLGGQPCREKTSCYALSKPCRNYQIGGQCQHKTFWHDDFEFVHILRTCKSVLQGVPCCRKERGEVCGYGHDHKDLRRLIDSWRRARGADREARAQETKKDRGGKLFKGQKRRRNTAAYKKAALEKELEHGQQ